MLFEEKYLLIEATCPQFRTVQRNQDWWHYQNFSLSYDWGNKTWKVIREREDYETSYEVDFFYDPCLKTALTKANYQDWKIKMCSLQKEVDKLNCKFRHDFLLYEEEKWADGGSYNFLHRENNQWKLYNQEYGITTTHASLEEAWEWHCIEINLIEHTHQVETLVKHPSLLEAWKQWMSNPNCRKAYGNYNLECARAYCA